MEENGPPNPEKKAKRTRFFGSNQGQSKKGGSSFPHSSKINDLAKRLIRLLMLSSRTSSLIRTTVPTWNRIPKFFPCLYHRLHLYTGSRTTWAAAVAPGTNSLHNRSTGCRMRDRTSSAPLLCMLILVAGKQAQTNGHCIGLIRLLHHAQASPSGCVAKWGFSAVYPGVPNSISRVTLSFKGGIFYE